MPGQQTGVLDALKRCPQDQGIGDALSGGLLGLKAWANLRPDTRSILLNLPERGIHASMTPLTHGSGPKVHSAILNSPLRSMS